MCSMKHTSICLEVGWLKHHQFPFTLTTLHVSPKMDQNGRFGTQHILRFRAGLRKHLLPSGEYAMHPLQRELRIKKAGIQVRGLWPF